MDYAEVLANAKKNIGPNCKVCPECNGLACANTMPGPGSKAPGNGANDNWKAWRGIKLNMDTIFPDAPVDTGIELFGKRLSMPLISAPVGSLKAQYNPTDDIRDFNECCAQAAEICGIASSFGDGLDARVFPHGCELSIAHGGIAIPVINPLSMETIKANLDLANAAHPFAVSLVIDSAGLPHLKKVSPDAGAKSVEQLRELCENIAKAYGASCVVDYQDSYPTLINNQELLDSVSEICREKLGDKNILLNPKSSLGADDFAYFCHAAKGLYFNLGCHTPGTPEEALHSAILNPDENCIRIGILSEVLAVLKIMGVEIE